MKVQVDKVVGCVDETLKNTRESYKDNLILINTPSSEKSLEFTEAEVNDVYFKDVGPAGHCTINLSSDKVIDTLTYNDITFPSVRFSEFQVFEDSIAFVSEIEPFRGNVGRLLKARLKDGIIELPDAVSDKLLDKVETSWSIWS